MLVSHDNDYSDFGCVNIQNGIHGLGCEIMKHLNKRINKKLTSLLNWLKQTGWIFFFFFLLRIIIDPSVMSSIGFQCSSGEMVLGPHLFISFFGLGLILNPYLFFFPFYYKTPFSIRSQLGSAWISSHYTESTSLEYSVCGEGWKSQLSCCVCSSQPKGLGVSVASC